MALSAKVDSLSAKLRESQTAATYAEKAMANFAAADIRVTDQYKFYVGLTFSLFSAATGLLGFFMYKRNKEEQAIVGDQVVKTLSPNFDSRLRRISKSNVDTQNDVDKVNRYQNTFAGETEARFRKIEEQGLDTKVKSLETNYKDLEIKLRESFAAPLIRFAQQQFDNKEYSAAFETILNALKKINPTDGLFHEGPEFDRCISTLRGFLINVPIQILDTETIEKTIYEIVKRVNSKNEKEIWEIRERRLPSPNS